MRGFSEHPGQRVVAPAARTRDDQRVRRSLGRRALECGHRRGDVLPRLKRPHREHVGTLHAEPFQRRRVRRARRERGPYAVRHDVHQPRIDAARRQQALARVMGRDDHVRRRRQRARQHEPLLQRVRAREPIGVLERHHVVDGDDERHPRARAGDAHGAVQEVRTGVPPPCRGSWIGM